MTRNDAANIGETDAVTLEIGSRVKPLEDAEELVVHVKADSVVANVDDHLAGRRFENHGAKGNSVPFREGSSTLIDA